MASCKDYIPDLGNHVFFVFPFQVYWSVFEGLVGLQEDMSSSSTSTVQADDTNMVKDSSTDVTSSHPPHKTEYDWVSNNVTSQFSKYRWLESLEYFVANVAMFILIPKRG